MKIVTLSLLAFFLTGLGCNSRPEAPPAASPPSAPPPRQTEVQRVRAPAVAGLFYPGQKKELSTMIDGLLERARVHSIPRLKGLICPHAGYVYSGLTAATGYKTLVGRQFETVVVLGPSHYAGFAGASVAQATDYQTPLGTVPISPRAAALVKSRPFVWEPRCLVQRPAWWAQSPKPAPPPGKDTPETWEHSVEVQVPFLQKTLTQFKVLPIILGEADPAQVAKGVAELLDDQTVVVASSDLSHYHPYAEAQALDQRCVKAICDLDVEAMARQEACGKLPILTLMHLARQKGWKAQLLDGRNSGDVTGEKDRVVGYAAIAFYAPAPAKLGAQEHQFLLQLARKTLVRVAANGALPEVSAVPPALREPRACFVTLTKGGTLRGCIGHLQAQEPLYLAVQHNAQNAACRDPRFPPVTTDEAGQIKIEISVLSEMEPLVFTSPDDLLAKLHPRTDGVLLQLGPRTATFLPQVWAQIPDKTEFLNRLSEKAGSEPGAWREKGTRVFLYHVEAFAESE